MEWLLKIVDGPMKGAEIALVDGMRVQVGSSDACDIVLADTALAEQAFQLDVSDDAVTRIGPDGEAKTLNPFVIFRDGASAFAIGPASGGWEELKEETPVVDAPPPDEPVAPPSEATPPAAEASAVTPSKPPRRRALFGCTVAVVLLVIGLCAWFFWPQLATARPPAPPSPPIPLSEIAAQHGLKLGERNGRPLLVGNLSRRTERLAIRALALAADPMTDFDLTDDESLCAAATDLLFVVTEGDLYATAATNRVVTLAGYAPDSKELERALHALNTDVPGIARLVTKDIQVGGVRPKRTGKFGYRREASSSESANAGGRTPGSTGKTGAIVSRSATRAYAIAGILTKPYPCIVMRNGMRLVEGAQVEGTVIEKIEVDKLTLKEGNRRIEWKP